MADVAMSRWNELLVPDDGHLPDGVARGFDVSMWQSVLDALVSSGWPLSFEREGKEAPLPAATSLFDGTVGDMVKVRPHPDVLVIVWPSSPDSFDFDVNVRELTSQTRLDAACGFIRLVGADADRDVELSYEGTHDSWFCRYVAAVDKFETRNLF